MADADHREKPRFGVYVHWPFCLSKCPYCDFNSHVRHAAIDESRFVRAFSTEIAATAARVPGRSVSTVFFGGGTPSLMQPQTIGAILEAIAQHWPIASDVEVTLEANPRSVEATRFAGYRAAGVNRVSIGLQSLDDGALRALGRLHSAREGLDAIAVARSVFDRYSFDLIYARPGQTPDAWAVELKCALAEAGEHLSLYQLTIEQGTPFHLLHASGVPPPVRPFLATRSPTTPGPDANAATTWSIGVHMNTPASDPERTAGWRSKAHVTRPRRRSGPRNGLHWSRRAATA